MSVSIRSFGGPVVWMLRKKCSYITSRIMLTYASRKYSRIIERYISWFNKKVQNDGKAPLFKNVMIETLNRCNGRCEFCPANVRDERRPYKSMSDELFYKIVDELSILQWGGNTETVYLNINNEPLIDRRITRFATYIKEKTVAKVAIITNGTLLENDILNELADVVDILIINDYGEKYRINSKLKGLYKYILDNKKRFEHIDITINRRYSKEILATRAGSAPNKPLKNNKIDSPCVYPFMDIPIFPDGKVGMCCNDCFEETDYGNVNDHSLVAIWNSESFQKLRSKLTNGRTEIEECRKCDVVDAGSREACIKEVLVKN